jgi:hypothetical protein
MQKTTTYLKATLLAITLVLGSAYVSAWTAPVSDPPGGSVALPVNTGANTQNKAGDLGVWNLTSNNVLTNGSFVIGDTNNLGRIKLGGYGNVTYAGKTVKDYGTGTTCISSEAGQMRYNSSTKAVEYCDGVSWKSTEGSAVDNPGTQCGYAQYLSDGLRVAYVLVNMKCNGKDILGPRRPSGEYDPSCPTGYTLQKINEESGSSCSADGISCYPWAKPTYGCFKN